MIIQLEFYKMTSGSGTNYKESLYVYSNTYKEEFSKNVVKYSGL